MEKYSSWNNIRPIYIKVYQDIFTSEEVQAQIDFYSTPIGQSILKNHLKLLAQRVMLLENKSRLTMLKTKLRLIKF